MKIDKEARAELEMLAESWSQSSFSAGFFSANPLEGCALRLKDLLSRCETEEIIIAPTYACEFCAKYN